MKTEIRVTLKENKHVSCVAIVLRKVETIYDYKGKAHHIVVAKYKDVIFPAISNEDMYETL